MARKLRIQFEGAIYHITIRGVGRQNLFEDEQDRERFLEQLRDGVEDDHVRLYMFCLMNNHAHLLAETPGGNLSRFMQRLQTAYTVYFNSRHKRSGHLMQGRYGAVLVEGDEYLLRLSRYVHLNPVQVRARRHMPLKERIKYLRGYRWSSYAGYIGRRPRLNYVVYEPILGMMERRRWRAEREYRRYVETGLVEKDVELSALKATERHGIGSDEFRARLRDLYQDMLRGRKRREDIAFRAQAGRLNAETIRKETARALGRGEADLARRSKWDWGRAILGRMLCRYGGLDQRAAAKEIGVQTGAAVCMQQRRLREALKTDRALARRVKHIEERLGVLISNPSGLTSGGDSVR